MPRLHAAPLLLRRLVLGSPLLGFADSLALAGWLGSAGWRTFVWLSGFADSLALAGWLGSAGWRTFVWLSGFADSLALAGWLGSAGWRTFVWLSGFAPWSGAPSSLCSGSAACWA